MAVPDSLDRDRGVLWRRRLLCSLGRNTLRHKGVNLKVVQEYGGGELVGLRYIEWDTCYCVLLVLIHISFVVFRTPWQ